MRLVQKRILQALNIELCKQSEIIRDDFSLSHQQTIGTNSGIPIFITPNHYHYKITPWVVEEELGSRNVGKFSDYLGINKKLFLETVANFVQTHKGDNENDNYQLAKNCIKTLIELQETQQQINEAYIDITEISDQLPLLFDKKNRVDYFKEFFSDIDERIIKQLLDKVSNRFQEENITVETVVQFQELRQWCKQNLEKGKLPIWIHKLSLIPALISFLSIGIPVGIYASDAFSRPWEKVLVGIPAWLAISFLCGNGNKTLFDSIFTSFYSTTTKLKESDHAQLTLVKKAALFAVYLFIGWISAGGSGEFAIKALLNGNGKQGWNPKEFCDAIHQMDSCQNIYKITAWAVIGLSYVFPMLGNTGYFESYPRFLQKTTGRFFSYNPKLPAEMKKLRVAIKQMLWEETKKINIDASRQEIKKYWGEIFKKNDGLFDNFERFLSLVLRQPSTVELRATIAKIVDAGIAISTSALAILGTFYYFLNGLKNGLKENLTPLNYIYSFLIWALNAVISQLSLQGIYNKIRHDLNWKAIIPMLICLGIVTPAITATYQQNIEVGSPIPTLISAIISHGGLTLFAFFNLFWPKSHRDQMTQEIETLLKKVDQLDSKQLKEFYIFLTLAKTYPPTASENLQNAATAIK